MKKNNNRKTWKKSFRARKRNRWWRVLNFEFDSLEQYEKFNKYRLEKGYSWSQFISIAIKNSV